MSHGFAGHNCFLTGPNWLPDTAFGARWIIGNSTFCVMPPIGSPSKAIAIAGFSMSNLSPSVAIGVAGAVIANNAEKSAFAMYADIQFEAGTFGYGLELAVKNKAADATTTPYVSGAGSVFGIQLSGGGDNAYGGNAANPSTAGLIFTKNAHTWNRGIVFKKDSITGADGETGSGIAIEMGLGHLVQWLNGTAAANLGISGSGANIDIVATPAGTGKLRAPRLNLSSLPTSASGLASGDVWNDSGTLKIV